VRPRIKVTDSDIAMAGTKYITPPQAKKSNVPQEYRIGVIVLPVDKPSREKEIDLLGAKLVKEVRGGASFEETYRQFSSAAAGAGGKFEPFWIRPEQLDPSVAKALEATNSGAITDPVRTHDGLTIIKVYETRNIDGSKPAPGEAPQENAPKPADHDQVYSLLFQQKMELEAQKYMRNLRRETYIDIR